MALSKIKRAEVKSRTRVAQQLDAQRGRIFTVADRSVNKILNERLASVGRLETFRLRQQERINKVNQDYLVSTQGVLNKQTLDFLVQQSNIDVPTFTSIFAGYELARASRADRSNAAREAEVTRLNNQIKAQEDSLKSRGALTDARIKLIQDGLDRNLKSLDNIQKSSDADIKDINAANRDIVDANIALEREDVVSGNRQDLQSQRDAQANARTSIAQAGANTRSANTITAQNQRTADTNASRERAARTRAENRPLTGINKKSALDFVNGALSDSFGFSETEDEVPVEVPVEAPVEDNDDFDTDGGLGFRENTLLGTDETLTAEVDNPVTENGLDSLPVIGTTFSDPEALAEAIVIDNANDTTVDIASAIEQNTVVQATNPETGEVGIFDSREDVPDGFVVIDEGVV